MHTKTGNLIVLCKRQLLSVFIISVYYLKMARLLTDYLDYLLFLETNPTWSLAQFKDHQNDCVRALVNKPHPLEGIWMQSPSCWNFWSIHTDANIKISQSCWENNCANSIQMISQHPTALETHLSRSVRRKKDVSYSVSTMTLHTAAHICLKAPRPSWWFRANHLALLGTRRLS